MKDTSEIQDIGTTAKEEISKSVHKINLILPDKVCEKVNHMVAYCKYFKDKKYSKSSFVLDAIQEKLERDLMDPKSVTQSDQSIFLKINPDSYDQISNQVELIRNFKASYSKKRWIEDAVLEKIENDESSCKLQLEKYQKELLENS